MNQPTLYVVPISADGLEIYGSLVKEGVPHDEKEFRLLRRREDDFVSNVRPVVGEHDLPNKKGVSGGGGG